MNRFDVEAYADQLQAMGVEYLFFTAWHAGIYNLGPNAALERWLPGHTVKRDLIGELADALNKRGIKLIIYAHPNDGHDLPPEEQARVGFIKPEKGVQRRMPKFDDFINEVYGELATRYADKPNLLGFYWDGWWDNGGAIDPVRLRKTLLAAMPRALVFSSAFNPAWIDFETQERYYINWGSRNNIDKLIVQPANQTTIFAGGWYCTGLQEHSSYTTETLFRFTVLQACSGAPGGICWAVSPTSDGKTWGSNNVATMTTVNGYIKPLRNALCGVAPSRNWTVPGGATYSTSRGYGATRSLDGSKEYLHVLKAPTGKSLDVELPRESFKSAHMLSSGNPVKIESLADRLRLTLSDADAWNSLDTVIVMDRETALTYRQKTSNDPSLIYSDQWSTHGSQRFTGSGGASVQFTFTGRRFVWLGVTGPDHGIAEVRIDNNPPVLADNYSAARKEPTVCYSANLPLGRHTVRITASGKANPAAKGSCIEVLGISFLESSE